MTTIIDIVGLAASTERTLSSSGDRTSVRLRREYGYSADEMWSAWTDPARLARWLGEVRGEPREGATVQLCMSPPDADIATVTIVACDAPRRLTVLWQWPDEPDSMVDLTIDAIDDQRSVLTLHHCALIEPTALSYGGGWEDFLLRLEVFVGGGDASKLSWSDDVEPVVQPRWTEAAANRAGDDRWPIITAQPGGSDIRVVRSIAAPIDRVWAAITDPEAVGQWFATVTGTLTVGDACAIDFDGGSASGVIRECTPPRRLVMTWRWSHEDADSVVTVDLAERAGGGDGTTVTVEQTGVVGPVVGYAAGWVAHAAGLERYLAGRERSESLWNADWELARTMLRSP